MPAARKSEAAEPNAREAAAAALNLDMMDLKMLRILQQRADLSTQELAERLNISHGACWRRLTRLKRSGVMSRTVTIMDPRKLGWNVTAIVTVRLERQTEAALAAFEKSVLECPEVLECFAMSGEQDFIMRVVAGSMEEYDAVLRRKLRQMPGVAKLHTDIALSTTKLSTALPI